MNSNHDPPQTDKEFEILRKAPGFNLSYHSTSLCFYGGY